MEDKLPNYTSSRDTKVLELAQVAVSVLVLMIALSEMAFVFYLKQGLLKGEKKSTISIVKWKTIC